MTFEDIKNRLMGEHVSYIKQGGHIMAYFKIDDVVPTYNKEELRFYGDDENGCRHHFPLTFKQAEELINNQEITIYTSDPFRNRKPKPLWKLILG